MADKPRFDGEWVRLGELTKCISKKNKDGHCTTVCSVTNSQGFVLSTEYFSKEVFSKELRSYKLVERNQLAYNPSRINVGSIALQDIDDEVVVSPLYVVFSVDANRIDPAYLLRYLKSIPGLNQVEFQSIGTVRNNLKYDGLCRIPIFLPPLEAQRSRVSSLIALETEIKDAEELLSKLDALVKSRFVEMFGDPVSNEMGWPASTIKETAIIYGDGPFGSNLKSSDYVDEGVRVIRLGNIQQGYFSEKDQSFVSYEKYEQLNHYKCSPGEIVIATLGSPILRACLVPDSCDPSIHKADCMYYEVDRDRLVPTFAMCVINHPSMLRRAAADVHGQTRGRINSTQTGALPMILPPLSLQQEFASFVAEVDKSRFIVQKQIEKLQTLYDNLAQEYFS